MDSHAVGETTPALLDDVRLGLVESQVVQLAAVAAFGEALAQVGERLRRATA